MDIVVVLLTLLLSVFSPSGDAMDEGSGEAGRERTTVRVEPPSDDPFPDDLGPLRSDRAIEKRFLTRYPLPTCDFVDLGGSLHPPVGSYDCLQEAVQAGVGAELVIATIRPGGDESFVYYRTNPDGPLEIFVDLQDDGSGRGWDYRRCPPSENIAEEPCA